MADYSSDRRSVLKLFGAISATCAYPFAGDDLYGQTVHEHTSSQSPARFFSETDFKTVSRIADLIIPATVLPGAVQAGVPEYIDFVVSRESQHQALVADGLRWLDAQAKTQGGNASSPLMSTRSLPSWSHSARLPIQHRHPAATFSFSLCSNA